MIFPFALLLLCADPGDGPEEFGPFFEAEPTSDTRWQSQGRKSKAPVLSVGNGAFCFVEGSHCKISLLSSGEVAAGMRAPASDKGPDIPYAHWGVRGGFTLRPYMLTKRDWHAWGVGIVGGWTRGTGSVTVESNTMASEQDSTERTDAWRVGMVNQLWLSQKRHALHLDLTMGVVRSRILTSNSSLFGTHTELAFGWGGWGAVYAGADFLDQDTRVVFGFRAHSLAAGPIIAAALLGLAMGGAL